MGLLGKAIAKHNAIAVDIAPSGGAPVSGDVQSFITNFYQKNSTFHAIVLQGRGDINTIAISDMIACHGAAIADLPGGNTLVLLPGALDRELFAHRLCHSAGLTALSQLSVDSPSFALEALDPYLR